MVQCVGVVSASSSGRLGFGFALDRGAGRRHLNESQRAMIAATLATMEHGGDRSKNSKGEISPLNIPSQKAAAELLNVSRNTVLAGHTPAPVRGFSKFTIAETPAPQPPHAMRGAVPGAL
jgi:hypothetical protein